MNENEIQLINQLAANFNQDISFWDVSNVISYVNFAAYSALTSANAQSKDGTKFPTTQP